jgi:hypothetical protein
MEPKNTRVLYSTGNFAGRSSAGYATQECGCLRFTDNIDLIVPDIALAVVVLRGSGLEVIFFIRFFLDLFGDVFNICVV